MNKNIKLIVNYLLGPLLFVVLAWSLYRQIIQQPDLELRWKQIRVSWQQWGFWVVFLMMFVNWGLEAVKWQVLISPLQRFSFARSFKAVMAGCSITMLTPNRVGEFGGRIMYVDEPFRLRAISLTILGSISQLAVTMVMGTAGLFLINNGYVIGRETFAPLPWLIGDGLFYLSLFITVILLSLYFRFSFLTRIIAAIPFLKGLVRFIIVVEGFTGKQLLRILFLSFLRYIVFILQYMLLLQVMDTGIPAQASLLLISVFYLVMVVAPTVGFTELPVRAAASVVLFGLMSTNVLGIQAAAFGIWLINLVLPAIAGSLLILGVKIMNER